MKVVNVGDDTVTVVKVVATKGGYGNGWPWPVSLTQSSYSVDIIYALWRRTVSAVYDQ